MWHYNGRLHGYLDYLLFDYLDYLYLGKYFRVYTSYSFCDVKRSIYRRHDFHSCNFAKTTSYLLSDTYIGSFESNTTLKYDQIDVVWSILKAEAGIWLKNNITRGRKIKSISFFG